MVTIVYVYNTKTQLLQLLTRMLITIVYVTKDRCTEWLTEACPLLAERNCSWHVIEWTGSGSADRRPVSPGTR